MVSDITINDVLRNPGWETLLFRNDREPTYCETACWPLVPEFAGSNPPEVAGFFGHLKNPPHAFLWRGSERM